MAGVALAAPAHAAGPQFLPLSARAHAPPLQEPVALHISVGEGTQWFCGSGDPSATEAHVPRDAGRLQALQASPQAWLQHTPWAQKPDTHSPAAPHSWPFPFRPHAPPLQDEPRAHWLLLLQEAKQLSPLQA